MADEKNVTEQAAVEATKTVAAVKDTSESVAKKVLETADDGEKEIKKVTKKVAKKVTRRKRLKKRLKRFQRKPKLLKRAPRRMVRKLKSVLLNFKKCYKKT